MLWEKSKFVLKHGIHETKDPFPIFLKGLFTHTLNFLPMNIESASRMCPNIEKMLFIHHPDCCPSLLPIAGCINKIKSMCFLTSHVDFEVIRLRSLQSSED
jgi:hypothetical protein